MSVAKGDTNETDAPIAVNLSDSDVKDAINFIFGQNNDNKETEFVEGFKRVDEKGITYTLKVKIHYYQECDHNETSIWITHTDKGCRV